MGTGSASLADETRLNAIQALTEFSGESAQRYASFFRYSEESRITSVEIHAVGNENTTARYSGREAPWREVNNILRIRTNDGFEGISGVDTYYQGPFSDEHLLQLQDIASELMAFETLDPVEVGSILDENHADLDDVVRASIDIALWDLAARKAGKPLYELLGASRSSMEPYASLPFYDTLPEYVAAVNEYANLGFSVFKFHVWGDIEKDLRLVELVQQTFAETPYRFMIDLEGVYGFEDSVRLGGQMAKGLFILLEGPIDDELLEQYADLKDRLAVQIIPAGYNHYSPPFIRRAIENGSWDAARFDATVVGGISKALELLMITNNAAMPVEIQSWGHSLGQAANLHLMLANERTPYFEAPMPKEPFEFGMVNGNLFDQGRIVAPDGPGLGISVAWRELPAADFHVHSIVESPPNGE
jgi:L-alanine-DL-glutamate epimerase-like enolase superfamily enzyme